MLTVTPLLISVSPTATPADVHAIAATARQHAGRLEASASTLDQLARTVVAHGPMIASRTALSTALGIACQASLAVPEGVVLIDA